MADYKIMITYVGGQFSYADGEGNDAKKKKCLSAGDTIQWKLVKTDNLNVANLKIAFDYPGESHPFDTQHHPGPPFTALTGEFTPKAYINNSHKPVYDYNVYLFEADNITKVDHNDPQVLFDDGKSNDVKGTNVDAAALVTAAGRAWGAVVDKLTDAAQKASSIALYPHGINDIEVTVTAPGNINITVKVIGPSS